MKRESRVNELVLKSFRHRSYVFLCSFFRVCSNNYLADLTRRKLNPVHDPVEYDRLLRTVPLFDVLRVQLNLKDPRSFLARMRLYSASLRYHFHIILCVF